MSPTSPSRSGSAALLADERVFIAAMQFGVNLRGVGHELAGVLHVRLGEQSEMGGFLMRAVLVAIRGAFAGLGRRTQVRGGVEMVIVQVSAGTFTPFAAIAGAAFLARMSRKGLTMSSGIGKTTVVLCSPPISVSVCK